MLRLAAYCVLMTATTFQVVAAPPYEPLSSNKRSSSNSGYSAGGSAQADVPTTTYGSGVKTYGTGGGDGDVTYSQAVDTSRPVAGSTSSSAGFDSYSQMQQMQQVQQEVLELRGTVEQLTHEIELMQKQARERYLDLDTRINQLRGGAAPVATTEDAAPETASQAVAVTGGDASADDKTLYDQASQLRRDGKFEESIAVLEDLLKRSPDGLYAPYCEYWLGETYMAVKPPKLDVAKTHFISLLGNHPDHVKVPDAMYKLGKLFADQGEKAKAKSALNELIKKHPEKPAAKLAKDLLKTL